MICPFCEKTFYRSLAEIRKNKTGVFFCSKGCRATNTNLKAPKQYARAALHTAIKNGTIVKPTRCERCGNLANYLEGHHHDYSKPLDVEWLCRPCHDIESFDARSKGSKSRHQKYFDPCKCGGVAIARNLCMRCYNAWFAAEKNKISCVVPGCQRGQHRRGLCVTHSRYSDIRDQFQLPAKKPGPKSPS